MTMKIGLIRYHRDELVVRSVLTVDGMPFCEAREACGMGCARDLLPEGRYACRCLASDFSPMTLKVCRQRGKAMLVGWDALRTWRRGMILLGYAAPSSRPATRGLERQDEAFAAFTRRLYAAYGRGEVFEMEVKDAPEDLPK